MRTHHDYSPSQLQSLECCPAYQGTDSQSEAAERGTKLHSVAETGIDDETLTDEEVQAAVEGMTFVARQKALLGDDAQELSEIYLPIDDEGTTAGYADAILLSGDRKKAILVDHKFGKWAVVEAANNRQSDAYALGIFHAYPTVEQVQVFFFQPAVEGENTVVWSREDVPELILRIKVIVARAKAAREAGDFSTAAPHTPVCNFCRHLAVCPAVAAKVISVAKKFSPLDVPDDLTPTKVHDPAQAAAGMRLAGIVEAWCKAFKNLVTDRALRGGPLPAGYELTSRATREITNAERFREIALAFVSDVEYQSIVQPPAITVVEKLIADKAPRGQKSSTLQAFAAATEDAGAVQKRQPYAFLKAKTE